MKEISIELSEDEEILWKRDFIDEYGIYLQKRWDLILVLVIPFFLYGFYRIMLSNEDIYIYGPYTILIQVVFYLFLAITIGYLEFSCIYSLIFKNYHKKKAFQKHYLLTSHRIIDGSPGIRQYNYSGKPNELYKEKDHIFFNISDVVQFTLGDLKKHQYRTIFFNWINHKDHAWLYFENLQVAESDKLIEIFKDRFKFKRAPNEVETVYVKATL